MFSSDLKYFFKSFRERGASLKIAILAIPFLSSVEQQYKLILTSFYFSKGGVGFILVVEFVVIALDNDLLFFVSDCLLLEFYLDNLILLAPSEGDSLVALAELVSLWPLRRATTTSLEVSIFIFYLNELNQILNSKCSSVLFS